MTKQSVTFKGILERSDSKIKKERALRVSEVTKIAFQNKYNALKSRILLMKGRVEEMCDLTASNIKTRDNRIVIGEFEPEEWVEARLNLIEEIEVFELRLKVYEGEAEFFGVTIE